MKFLAQIGVTELISKVKAWVTNNFLNREEVWDSQVIDTTYATMVETTDVQKQEVDTTVTQGSSNLITSGAVYTALTTEEWTFTLADGSTVTKNVVVK